MNSRELTRLRQSYSDEIDAVIRDRGRGSLASSFPGLGKTTKNIELIRDASLRSHLGGIVVITGAKRNQKEYILACEEEGVVFKVLGGKPNNCPHKVEWKDYDRKRLYRLGKKRLCVGCFLRNLCDHPKPLSELITGTEVIITTAAKVITQPDFLRSVMKAFGTVTPLVIIDEDSYIMSARKVRVSKRDLKLLALAGFPKLSEMLSEFEKSLREDAASA